MLSSFVDMALLFLAGLNLASAPFVAFDSGSVMTFPGGVFPDVVGGALGGGSILPWGMANPHFLVFRRTVRLIAGCLA